MAAADSGNLTNGEKGGKDILYRHFSYIGVKGGASERQRVGRERKGTPIIPY